MPPTQHKGRPLCNKPIQYGIEWQTEEEYRRRSKFSSWEEKRTTPSTERVCRLGRGRRNSPPPPHTRSTYSSVWDDVLPRLSKYRFFFLKKIQMRKRGSGVNNGDAESVKGVFRQGVDRLRWNKRVRKVKRAFFRNWSIILFAFHWYKCV